jgi:hypothetical protein
LAAKGYMATQAIRLSVAIGGRLKPFPTFSE